MSDIFYKVMINQVSTDFISVGSSVLTKDYANFSNAKEAAASYSLSPMSAVEIRRYDLSQGPAIVSFGKNDTGEVVYSFDPLKKSGEDLAKAVVSLYKESDDELSEEYLSDLYIDMTKGELIKAWAEIQLACNGDVVIRLDKNGEELPEDELISKEWGDQPIKGNARDELLLINEERNCGGPIFARWYDDNEEYLDLVFGEFEIETEPDRD